MSNRTTRALRLARFAPRTPRASVDMSATSAPGQQATMVAPVGTVAGPQEQTLFYYRFRIFAGIHAVMEIPCLALALYMYMILPLFWFLTGAIGSAIAMIVSANVAGKFCCYPSGNYRRLGSWLNAIFMLISFILSLPLLYFATYVASWCAANGNDYGNELQDLCGGIGAGAAFSVISALFRLVISLIMIPYCCCGWTGVQAKQVQVVEVRTA
jgi:hypothetical protein